MSNILEKIELMSAEDLLDTYNIKTYPEVDTVDISDLYDKLGIKTYLKNFSDFESETGYKNVKGVVLSDKENVAIFISKKLSKNERRYMIAHLLGHCCCTDFNEYNIRHVETNDDCDIVHKNAENFAMELLMSENSLTLIMKKLLFPSLKVLTQIYQLEPKLIKKRLDDLHLVYYKDMFW